MSRRVAIVGTREPTPKQEAAVRALVAGLPAGTVVVSGAARGVDSIAAHEARRRGFTVAEHFPNWKQLGKSAGFVRNGEIVKDADEVHAFPGDGGGTWDTIRRAKAAGKTCTVHEER